MSYPPGATDEFVDAMHRKIPAGTIIDDTFGCGGPWRVMEDTTAHGCPWLQPVDLEGNACGPPEMHTIYLHFQPPPESGYTQEEWLRMNGMG